MQKTNYKITYNQSFKARCIRTNKKTKDMYKEIKEELLSYNGLRSRISWQYDSFSYKREKKAILTIRGNTLTLYLNLDPNSIIPKYKIGNEANKKSYEECPLSLKIKGKRTLSYAKELINLVLKDLEYHPKKINNKAFNQEYAYQSIPSLIKEGLIKERKRKINHKIKIYAVVLPKIKGDLYLVSNLYDWQENKAIKLDKVYDNYYELELNLPTCNFEFKIVGLKDYLYVEKGIWHEEIVNHHYYVNDDMVIEDIIHSFREDINAGE